MADFGWNYPPGVTGQEPQIAGYGDELWIENADEEVWDVVKNYYLRKDMNNKKAVIMTNIFFKIWDITDKVGPEEEEIWFMAYLGTRRQGYDEIESKNRADFIVDSVLYQWEDLKNLWNMKYRVFENSGPDPDQQYEEMRDREWDRDEY